MEEILNRTIYARCQRRFEVRNGFSLSPIILFRNLDAGTTRNDLTDDTRKLYGYVAGSAFLPYSLLSLLVQIDPSIPALTCEFLPESTPEERLFISISPYSGLYKVVSYMGNPRIPPCCLSLSFAHLSRKSLLPADWECAQSRSNQSDRCNQFVEVRACVLFDVLFSSHCVFACRTWLIQQRIPTLLAHLNCRIYTRIPSINLKNERIAPFINSSLAIELPNHEGFYIVR